MCLVACSEASEPRRVYGQTPTEPIPLLLTSPPACLLPSLGTLSVQRSICLFSIPTTKWQWGPGQRSVWPLPPALLPLPCWGEMDTEKPARQTPGEEGGAGQPL